MSTFFAALPDSVRAQQMVRHLLNDGIGLDDISLVAPDITSFEATSRTSTGDASYFVGGKDDPETDLVDTRSPEAEAEAVEASPIGGGISTSDRTLDVEWAGEMDESQEAAEDQATPEDDKSHSRHEMDDLDLAVRTGFPSPVTPIDHEIPSDTESDRSLEPVAVNGVGVVMGGGDLATAAFDWVGKAGEPDSVAFLTYLQDEGVPPATANELLSMFGNGSSILGIALDPSVDEGAIEEIAEHYGAVTTGWFGAPRF